MAPELPRELVDDILDLVALNLEEAKPLLLDSPVRAGAYAAMLSCHSVNREFRARARMHIFKRINLTLTGITQGHLIDKIRVFHEILEANPTIRLCIHSLDISTSSGEDAAALTHVDNGLPQIITSLYSTPNCPIDELTLRGRSDAAWTHTSEAFRCAIYSLLKSGSIKHLTIEEVHHIPAIIFSQIASCLHTLTLGACSFTVRPDIDVIQCIGATPAAQPAELGVCQIGTLPLEIPRLLHPVFFSSFLQRVEVLKIRQYSRVPQQGDGTQLWNHVTRFLAESPVKELHVAAEHFFLPPLFAAIDFTPFKHLVHFEFSLRSPPHFAQFATAKLETVIRTNTNACPTLETARFIILTDSVSGYEADLYHKDVCNHMFLPFFDNPKKYPRMQRVWLEVASPDYGPSGPSRMGKEEFQENTPPLGQLAYAEGGRVHISKRIVDSKFIIDVEKVQKTS